MTIYQRLTSQLLLTSYKANVLHCRGECRNPAILKMELFSAMDRILHMIGVYYIFHGITWNFWILVNIYEVGKLVIGPFETCL